MTTIIRIRKSDRVHIITDGAGINQANGQLASQVSKVALVATAPGIVAGRGNVALCHAIAGEASAKAWSFDELVTSAPKMARKFKPFLPSQTADDEIVLAGYSKEHQRLIIYFMPCADHMVACGMNAFTLYEQTEDMVAAPKPSNEAQSAVGFECPSAEDFDPHIHGIRLVDAMRGTPEWSGAVGCFVQVSTVTRDDVSSGIVHRWTDNQGQVNV